MIWNHIPNGPDKERTIQDVHYWSPCMLRKNLQIKETYVPLNSAQFIQRNNCCRRTIDNDVINHYQCICLHDRDSDGGMIEEAEGVREVRGLGLMTIVIKARDFISG